MPKTQPSAGMATHVAQRVTSLTDLVRFQALDGTVIGLTRLDKDLDFDDGQGVITYSKSEGLTISALETAFSPEIDNLSIECFLSPDGFTRDNVINGKWRFAEVRTFRVNWKDLSLGAWKMRRGKVGGLRRPDRADASRTHYHHGVFDWRGARSVDEPSAHEHGGRLIPPATRNEEAGEKHSGRMSC